MSIIKTVPRSRKLTVEPSVDRSNASNTAQNLRQTDDITSGVERTESKAATTKQSSKSVRSSTSKRSTPKPSAAKSKSNKSAAANTVAVSSPTKSPAMSAPSKKAASSTSGNRKALAKTVKSSSKNVPPGASAKAASLAKKVARVTAAKQSEAQQVSSPAELDEDVVDAPKRAPPPRRTNRQPKAAIILPEGYVPTESEPFMSARQRAYFRQKLVEWKEDIIRQTRETLDGMNQASEQHADITDRATSETDRALELRARDRQRKLVSKINSAIARIDDGSYGYCEESGEPIGLRRLEARPIATLSLEAQERHERRERVFRDD